MTISLSPMSAMSPETRECPFEGIYAVNVPGSNERPVSPSSDKTLFICSEQSSLNSKCNSNDHMQLQSRCNYNDAIRSMWNNATIGQMIMNDSRFNLDFRCRGGWEENGTNYLIASSNEDDIRQYCLVYDKDNNELQMTISSATCLRSVQSNAHSPASNPRENHLALKLTNTGMIHLVSHLNIH